MTENTVEISIKGKPVEVSAININGHNVIVTGRWIKVASFQDESYLEGGLEDPESYISSLKERRSKGLKADIFTFAQKLPNTEPKHPYFMEWDNTAAIRLSSFDDWWKDLPSATRSNVKRSTKRGVVTKVQKLDEDLVRGIVEINNESPIRQGKRFWHYGKKFDTVKKDYATFLERSEYIGAYFQDQLIGFTKLVYVGKVAAIMQNLSKLSHYDKKTSNALIAKAVEHCAKRNFSYLTYVKYRYGNKRDSSLTEFKRRNGFEEILIPRFYVPLTAKGRVAIALRLHRSLVEILPERLIDVLLGLRTKWYEWCTGRRPV